MQQTYDQALQRLQEIVTQLEKEEALSVAQYKQLAAEATELLTFCRAQLVSLEAELLPETANQ